jgi:hypothetical protein
MRFRDYLITISVIWIVTIFVILLISNIALGDDTEDHGRLPLYDRLLKNAREWNIMKLINETLAMSERFNK